MRDSFLGIREATPADFDSIWPIFHRIVSAADTYTFSEKTTRQDAEEIWLKAPRKTFVYEREGEILGTYYLKTNHNGPGSHVCNCGYMVSSASRGQGLATSMCKHSQEVAKQLGYKAMQFNSVASTNVGAVRLWNKLGFETVGVVPKAFRHPEKGYVDLLVMYKWL
ncbi:MAG: GNAT family N-acetyltransferase [Arenicella sp.]